MNVKFYLSDLSFIQNIIYLTAKFLLGPKEKIGILNKHKKIRNKINFNKINTIYR
jgi:hypothetical protein